MSGRLKNKVVLVTGGGAGIGRASAVAFAREGARVSVADVDAREGQSTVQKIREADGEAIFIRADVSKVAEVEALVDETIKAYGRLDCAFNNAGIIGELALTADCTEENWDRVIGVNLKGIWLCMKYEIPQMLKQGGGAIVNASSVMGLVGSGNGAPAYIAGKHGVTGLTKAAALEYAQNNIRINAVCPGFIRTQMVEYLTGGSPEAEKGLIAREPVGRLGTTEEVAEIVVWLCSDAASFVTGHALAVDGGYTVQ